MGLILRALHRRWPGGCVPYSVDTTNLDSEREQAVDDAIAEWQARTDVRFVKRDRHDAYIRFVEVAPGVNAWGQSYVGRQGGQQYVFLKDDFLSGGFKATAVHEIGHALGMGHEHQRPDRDDFVRVREEKAPGDKAHFERNYGRWSDADAMAVGDYDFCSVMQYSTGEAKSEEVIVPRDSSRPCALEAGRASSLSAGDVATADALMGGRGEVVRISASAQFEETVAQYGYSTGWDVLASYTILNSSYVFMLKSGSGLMRVRQVNPDGTLADARQTDNWSSGWTNAVPYSVGTDNFLLLYKRSTGDTHVHKLKADGTVGARIVDTRLGTGFVGIVAYNVLTLNFLFMIKRGNGDARVLNIAWNGMLAHEVDRRNWSSGWTAAVTYKIGFDNFIAILKERDGSLHVHRLEGTGHIGQRVQSADVEPGFTRMVWLPIGLSNALMLVSPSGRVETYALDGGGRVAERLDVRRLGRGVRALATYGAVLGRYLLITT